MRKKEAKIGLAVVLVLGGVFAFIVYKGMQPRDTASNSKAKESGKGKSGSPAKKSSGGLLDRWNLAPAAKVASDGAASGQGSGKYPAQTAASQGGGGQGSGGQDPFAGRSTALDRYSSRYDQQDTSDRQRLSIYGDDSGQQAGGTDDAGNPPAPLPATDGDAVRRVSVYGPAENNTNGGDTDGANPLRSGATGATASASSNTYGGTADPQGAYDPPSGGYGYPRDSAQTSDPRAADGAGATAQSNSVDNDDAWRRSATAGATSGAGASAATDSYDAAQRGTSTYGSGTYDRSGYAADSRYDTGADSRSPANSQQAAQSDSRYSSAQDSQYGSSQYDAARQGSQYATSGSVKADASTGASYESASYGRSTTAGLQPVPSAARAAPGKYVVEPNDSCWLISRKVFGTGAYFKAIEEHNRHNYPRMDQLQVGDVLEVPTAEQLRAAYPDLCPKIRGAAPANPRNYQVSATRRTGGGRVYVVQDGDNLFDIARYELGSAKRWVEIFDLNRELLSDDYDYLPVGAQLILPDEPASQADTVTERPGSPYSR